MTTLPLGNNTYAWKLKELPGDAIRNPASTAAIAKALGFKSLWLKVTDGLNNYNYRETKPNSNVWVDDIVGPFLDACAAVGVDVWAFVYYYGANPEIEARKVVQRMAKFPLLKGVIVDAEAECISAGVAGAERYMKDLRAVYPGPVGLSSFRWPSVWSSFPWKAFVGRVDFQAPQVYWVEATNSAQQLDRSFKEYTDLYASLGKAHVPFIPTGAAYHEKGWQPTIAQMQVFSARATALNLPGISWWEWANAERYGLTAGMRWTPAEPPEPPTLETRVARLEAWAKLGGYVP